MEMASEFNCGNEDTPQNSVSLMNIILRKYRTPNVPVAKFSITNSQFLYYNLILAMLQPLLLLENVSDSKSLSLLTIPLCLLLRNNSNIRRKLNIM